MLKRAVTPQSIDFATAYDNCNPPQRDAIDNTEGTVMVVAGPGTGKTQIIAARIAGIIRQGNSPETILCLTYTDAGTIAMRERLLAFIGTEAYRTNIYTFHAFCNLVIQENPSQFGFNDLQPASELEKLEIVQEVLDALPHDNPLAREKGDLYSDTKNLLKLYADMKREDWLAEDVSRATDAFIASLPEQPGMRYLRKYKEFQPGDLKQHLIDAETRKYERFKAAVNSFGDFQRLMREKKRYDFDDMILWVINAFKGTPELLTNYQERYQYLLVDEYQDTSGSQNEVVDLLMSYWDDPNLFVVGDDDQSIYRFQGASIENILSFNKKYSPHTVTLTGNYRSSQQILNAAMALIRANAERLANSDPACGLNIAKELTANRPAGELPEIRVYPTVFQESIGIALELEARRERGEDLGKVAVLYRNHRQAEQIIRYLTAKKIPLNSRRRENVLAAPIVRQLLSILKYLNGEMHRPHSQERLLFMLLHHPSLALQPLEIARLYLPGDRLENDRRSPVRERLAKSAPLSAVSELLETSLSEQSAYPLQEFVHRLISRFGILTHISSADDAVWQMTALNTFFAFIREECAKSPLITMNRLVELIETMEQRELPLQAERLLFDRSGVNFITTHSAKGLEFATVYLLGCNAGEWEDKKNRTAFSIPPNLFANQAESGQSELEELRRLFYVAMTRAERELVISYSARNDNGKELARSCFVAELERSGTVACNDYQLESSELEAAMPYCLQESPENLDDLFTSDLIGERLKEYKLSVTHLNSYLKCQRAFFFEHILRVPQPKNSAMAFGTSVHKALEHIFTLMQQSKEHQFPPKELFLARFTREMLRNQDAFTAIEFERRLKGGEETLGRFYDLNLPLWHKEVLLEKPFMTVLDDAVPLNGLVDKLELFGSRVNLVDYKTGKYDKKKFLPPDPVKVQKSLLENTEPKHEQLHGGDYWRQAVFYKLLLEQNPASSYQVESITFSFVEPDEKKGEYINHRAEITALDEELVRAQIKDVYSRIMARQFAGSCSSKYCEWCRKTG